MRSTSKKFLVDLLAAPGPSGYEGPVRAIWQAEVEKYAERVDVDVHGNAVGVYNGGGGPRIMFAGHMDELGFQVIYIDEEGYIWHKGRLKRFVKIGGEMISLVMVEEALASLLSDSIECCAVELPDAKRGSRIVGVTNQAIDEKEIGKQLSEDLPNLALPKKYVVVGEFPYMGSGKTDFRTLTRMVREMESSS